MTENLDDKNLRLRALELAFSKKYQHDKDSYILKSAEKFLSFIEGYYYGDELPSDRDPVKYNPSDEKIKQSNSCEKLNIVDALKEPEKKTDGGLYPYDAVDTVSEYKVNEDAMNDPKFRDLLNFIINQAARYKAVTANGVNNKVSVDLANLLNKNTISKELIDEIRKYLASLKPFKNIDGVTGSYHGNNDSLEKLKGLYDEYLKEHNLIDPKLEKLKHVVVDGDIFSLKDSFEVPDFSKSDDGDTKKPWYAKYENAHKNYPIKTL